MTTAKSTLISLGHVARRVVIEVVRPLQVLKRLPDQSSEDTESEGWETRHEFLWIRGSSNSPQVQVQGNPADIQILSLDWYSLGDALRGYQSEVLPELQLKLREPSLKGVVDGVFPFERPISPIRDLPDIYVRSALRAEMWAALLANKRKLHETFWGIEARSDRIVIVSTTMGSTGSAWAREVAIMLRKLAPTAQMYLILLHVDELPMPPGTLSQTEAKLRAAYCITELGDLDSQSSNVWLARVPDLHADFANVCQRIRGLLIEEETRMNMNTWALDVEAIMMQASESLRQLAAYREYPQWRLKGQRARSIKAQRAFRCACLTKLVITIGELGKTQRCKTCGLELVV